MKKNKYSSAAFTLIETLIAITLITVVITAVTGLILVTLMANERNVHNLQANYLAQESLEAVRFMRDSNWLQNYGWNGGETLWVADFDLEDGETERTLYLKEEECPPCFGFSTEEESVVTTVNGTEYTRSLTFTPVLDPESGETLENALEVKATVSWEERGLTRSIELSTYLTDWQ
jgi:type II secretory pathway pseudopilin PulG